MKRITHYAITHDLIQDLVNFLVQTKYEYNLDKSNLSQGEFVGNLQILCGKIDKRIVSTIQYFQTNDHGIKIKSKAKEVCRTLNLLLSIYENELEELGAKTRNRDFDDFYGSMIEENQNVSYNNEQLLSYSNKIEAEFLEYIKVETQQPKKINLKETTAFKVGLLFANKGIQKQIKELRDKKFSYNKIAVEFGFKLTDHNYFNETYNNTIRSKEIKNIYIKKEVMLLLEEHCIQNGISMCQEFLSKLEEVKCKEI